MLSFKPLYIHNHYMYNASCEHDVPCVRSQQGTHTSTVLALMHHVSHSVFQAWPGEKSVGPQKQQQQHQQHQQPVSAVEAVSPGDLGCGGPDRAPGIASRQPEWRSVTLGAVCCAGAFRCCAARTVGRWWCLWW